jgi:polyisoprenoid-binding protein YceI
MMPPMLRRLPFPAVLLFPAILLLAGAASARDWSAQPDASTLIFTATVERDDFDGRFDRFAARIRFDPETLDGRFEVDIALDSLDSQNSERDDMLAEPEFFDSRQQPRSQYLAERFERLDDGRFRADGALTLRGVTRPVPLLFRWQQDGDAASLDGEAVLDRLAFGVGLGDWADTDLIAREVRVRTRLQLRPAD